MQRIQRDVFRLCLGVGGLWAGRVTGGANLEFRCATSATQPWEPRVFLKRPHDLESQTGDLKFSCAEILVYKLWCFCGLCSRSRFVTAKPDCLLCNLIWITHLSILQDPALQELESNFVIQQKLVEAAKKLASEPDLCKNVKKKRKQEYADAVKKLQEIENSINEYRIKCGKKPTQKSSLTLPGKQENSPCSDENRKKEVTFGSLMRFVYISLRDFYLLWGS